MRTNPAILQYMQNFPKSLFEFNRMFGTEQACWNYLKEMRWPDGVVDYRDGKTKPIGFCSTRKVWEFPDHFQQTVIAGTVMHKTRTPLTHWFYAAYLMATLKPGVSALQLSQQLGMRLETTYMLLMKLRSALVNPFRTKLRGTIEVDETYVGAKVSGKRGRGAGNKSIVIGAVEVIDTSDKQVGGRIRMRKIPSIGGDYLEKFILENAEKGSTIVTDGYRGYSGIENKGYNHRIITGESSEDIAKKLRHIHIVFGNLKAFLNGTYHGVSSKHLQAYLNEYVFRFNRRRLVFESFNTLLGIGTTKEGPTYYQLYHTGGKHGWTHPNPQG